MVNVALVIGKANSTGVPGKNVRPYLSQPSVEYSFQAAKAAGVDAIFVSTDSPEIANVGERYGASVINRPPSLCTPEALTEDVLKHASEFIEDAVKGAPEIMTLLFANNPCVDSELLRKATKMLMQNQDLDSVFSVVRYDMFSPHRARKLGPDSEILPFMSDTVPSEISSLRSDAGAVYFCDLSVQVIRWNTLANLDVGTPPFRWMGRRSKGIVTDFGFDVDSDWQVPVVEHWLKTHPSALANLLAQKTE